MIEVIFNTNGVRTTLHGSNTSVSITEESSAASKLECKVYCHDESFENLFPDITDVLAYDTYTNDVVFEGVLYSAKPSMDQDGKAYADVIANHILSRLTRACVVGFEDASGNIYTMVSRILAIYNATAPEQYQILMGTCPRTGGHPDVVHIFSATCFDALTQLVVTEAGWEFRARYSDAHWYLDIADDFGEYTTTDIIEGVNMLSISKTVDSSELYTRIIPIGGASYIPSDKINPTMSTLNTSDSGMPLTLYGYDANNLDKIYVANEALESKYPPLIKIVQYDDISATDESDFASAQAELASKAEADAEKLTDVIEAYEVTAMDLYRAGYSYDAIELNKMYHIVNHKLSIDTWLKVTSKRIDYSNPVKSDLTFGPIGRVASRYLTRKGKTTDQRINAVGSASYTTTDKRMGGMSLRNTSATEYHDGSTHDASTLYTVSDATTGKVELYLGDTKISGEEGGGVSVESAALLNTGTFYDFTINRELMLNVSAETKLYYGGKPAFIVLQGHLCLFANANIADHMIDGDTAILDAIADNAEYFGSQYGDLTDIWHANGKDNGFFAYSANNIFVYAHSITIASVGLTTSNSAMDERVTIVYSYGSDTTQPASQYVTPATVTPIVTKGWTFVPARALSYYSNGTWTGDIPETASDLLLVPFVTGISASSYANRPTPYGYATRLGYIIVYRIDGKWYVHEAATRIQVGANSYIFPFTSEAELHFALGAAQRSEPVEVTP